MEKTSIRRKLPKTDSIDELARFWDTHDLTDFENDLEQVGEPVFVRTKGTSLSIDLQPAEAQRLTKIARAKGVKEKCGSAVGCRETTAVQGYDSAVEPEVVSQIHFTNLAI